MKTIALEHNKSMHKIISRIEIRSCEHFKKSKEVKTSNKKSARNILTNRKEVSKIEMKIREFERMKK